MGLITSLITSGMIAAIIVCMINNLMIITVPTENRKTRKIYSIVSWWSEPESDKLYSVATIEVTNNEDTAKNNHIAKCKFEEKMTLDKIFISDSLTFNQIIDKYK